MNTVSFYDIIYAINHEISEMVLNAKNGEWENVWEILNRNVLIINMIPAERAWSALHQAVWHRNFVAVKKLISYNECDVLIRAKGDLDGQGVLGMTPRALADKYNYTEIANILKVAEQDQPRQEHKTSVSTSAEVINSGNPCHLFYVGLAIYEDILLGPGPFDSQNISCISILRAVFNFQQLNWKNTQLLIRENMIAYSENQHHQESDWFSLPTNCNDFFIQIIKLYTGETELPYKNKGIYEHLNYHLRQTNYLEDGSSLLMLPYLILFQCILLFWENIPSIQEVTYRGMVLSNEDANFYKSKLGTTFEWMSFTSSSLNRSVAKRRIAEVSMRQNMQGYTEVLFTMINDKCTTDWFPKLLGTASAFSEEEEAIYPAGVIFKIVNITFKNNRMDVMLELAGPTQSQVI